MEPTGFRVNKFIVLFAFFSYSVSASTFPKGFSLLPTLPSTRDTSLFPYREMTSHYMDDSSSSLGWYMIHELRDTKKEMAHLRNLLADARTGLSLAEEKINDLTTKLAATNADLVTTKTSLATANVKLGTVTSGLAGVKIDLGTINANLGNVTSGLAGVKINLGTTNANLGNVTSGLADTNANLATTNTNLATINTTLTSNLAAVKVALGATNTSLGIVTSDLAGVKTDLGKTNTSLETVTSGLADVKGIVNAPPIMFYVQRESTFSTKDVSIPFEVEKLNAGGAMNLTTGIFTAPRAGKYFFSFSATSSDQVTVDLYINDMRDGRVFVGGRDQMLSFPCLLTLNVKDQVSLKLLDLGSGALYDDGGYTHFSGFFLHE